MSRFLKSPQKPARTVAAIAATAAGIGLLGLLSSQVANHQSKANESLARPASTFNASAGANKSDGKARVHKTEFPHVQVSFEPSNREKETPNKNGAQSAWVYVRPGTKRPANVGTSGVRRPTAIRTESLPGGGTIVHLDRALMSASTVRRESSGANKNQLKFDCVKNHDHSEHSQKAR